MLNRAQTATADLGMLEKAIACLQDDLVPVSLSGIKTISPSSMRWHKLKRRVAVAFFVGSRPESAQALPVQRNAPAASQVARRGVTMTPLPESARRELAGKMRSAARAPPGTRSRGA